LRQQLLQITLSVLPAINAPFVSAQTYFNMSCTTFSQHFSFC